MLAEESRAAKFESAARHTALHNAVPGKEPAHVLAVGIPSYRAQLQFCWKILRLQARLAV